MTSTQPLRVATRGSALALWQTRFVTQLLGVECEEVVVTSAVGDRDKQSPIVQLGVGIFVKEIQDAVLDGRADFAVHSAKDLQSSATDGLVIASVPQRGEVRDALVGSTLADLPQGARIGTDSVRRRAQLAAARPDFVFAGLRGNVDTRLGKAKEYDAIILAAVGVERIGRAEELTEVLSTEVVLPQIAQGALAVECRADNEELIAVLQTIEDWSSRRAVDAERAYLASVGGGCDVPVGAWARVCDDVNCSGTDLHMTAIIASEDGSTVIRKDAQHDDAITLGKMLAEAVKNDSRASALMENW